MINLDLGIVKLRMLQTGSVIGWGQLTMAIAGVRVWTAGTHQRTMSSAELTSHARGAGRAVSSTAGGGGRSARRDGREGGAGLPGVAGGQADVGGRRPPRADDGGDAA